MARSEREIPYFWFLGRVFLCFSFKKEFKFQIVLLTWEGFADDMEGQPGKRKNKQDIVHVLDIILPINSGISYFVYLGFQNHIFSISRAQNLTFPIFMNRWIYK